MTGIPVVLLTGFLGSGKTTLINDLLKWPAFHDTAVVVNEAGEAGIDHALIEAGSDELVLLEGGCLCCSMRGGLNRALATLQRRRAQDVNAFNRVVVETSGLADPAPVLHALLADPSFNRHFSLSGVATAVDAANFQGTLARHPECAAQVALADRVLIAKADLVDSETLERVARDVAGLNPNAEQCRLSLAARDGRLVWIDPLQDSRLRCRPFSAAATSHDVATAALTFPGRLTREAVDDWLDHVDGLFGGALLRLKGIVCVDELTDPVVVHGVQGLIYSPGTLEVPGTVENRMVLIARDIAQEDLKDALARLARVARIAA